jgi:hypothetical protein
LHARHPQRHGLRQGANQKRLAEAWDSLDEHMSRYQERNDGLIDDGVLTDQSVADLGPQFCEQFARTHYGLGFDGHSGSLIIFEF